MCEDGIKDHADERYPHVRVPRLQLEQVRDAVAFLRGDHPRITLKWAIGRGLDLVREELETHYNHGQQFPARLGPLPRGRTKGTLTLAPRLGSVETED